MLACTSTAVCEHEVEESMQDVWPCTVCEHVAARERVAPDVDE